MSVAIAEPLRVSVEQREALEAMARSSSLPHRKVVQAGVLLLAADGFATNEVARRCRTTAESVRAWRRRFEVEGVDGVGRIAPGRGRKPGIADEVIDAIVSDTPRARSHRWTRDGET